MALWKGSIMMTSKYLSFFVQVLLVILQIELQSLVDFLTRQFGFVDFAVIFAHLYVIFHVFPRPIVDFSHHFFLEDALVGVFPEVAPTFVEIG